MFLGARPEPQETGGQKGPHLRGQRWGAGQGGQAGLSAPRGSSLHSFLGVGVWGLAGEAGRVPPCVLGVTCCYLHRANATRTPWRRWARQTQGVGAVRRRPSSRCQAASFRGGAHRQPRWEEPLPLPRSGHMHTRARVCTHTQPPHTLVPCSLPTPYLRVALGLHLLCLCPSNPHNVPGPPALFSGCSPSSAYLCPHPW